MPNNNKTIFKKSLDDIFQINKRIQSGDLHENSNFFQAYFGFPVRKKKLANDAEQPEDLVYKDELSAVYMLELAIFFASASFIITPLQSIGRFILETPPLMGEKLLEQFKVNHGINTNSPFAFYLIEFLIQPLKWISFLSRAVLAPITNQQDIAAMENSSKIKRIALHAISAVISIGTYSAIAMMTFGLPLFSIMALKTISTKIGALVNDFVSWGSLPNILTISFRAISATFSVIKEAVVSFGSEVLHDKSIIRIAVNGALAIASKLKHWFSSPASLNTTATVPSIGLPTLTANKRAITTSTSAPTAPTIIKNTALQEHKNASTVPSPSQNKRESVPILASQAGLFSAITYRRSSPTKIPSTLIDFQERDFDDIRSNDSFSYKRR